MEVLNPAWKRKQKRRLFGVVASLAAIQAVSVNSSDFNPFKAVVEAFSETDIDTPKNVPEKAPVNETGRMMQGDLASYSPVDPDWALGVAQDKGSSVYLGEQISVADAMRYNYIAGFRGQDLIIKTAIDGKESNYHPGAVGDVNWNIAGDRSVGTAQIYCQPNGDITCEGIRDWRANFDPQANAAHSYALYVAAVGGANHDNGLSSDGRFAPWRNNPDGVRQRIPRAEEVYQELSALYGDLSS